MNYLAVLSKEVQKLKGKKIFQQQFVRACNGHVNTAEKTQPF